MNYAIDPFTVEVIRHGLTAAAEEMSFVVMRSARSPLLRESGDLSSALTDHEGNLIAQGRDIPGHLGVMSFTVKQFLERVAPERLNPGDVWFLNLPEVGGNHLPDVKAIRPIFLEGRLFAFAVSLAHWGDIGGAWAGSYFVSATETWQEGLRIPPLRLFTADGIDEEKRDLLLANVRGPAEREGDILAQMAATQSADARLQQLCRDHGAATIRAALDRLDSLSEAQMREAIAGLPDGVYEGEDFLDDGGPNDEPAAIRVRITIKGDHATFDFSGTDDAVANPLNTTPFVARAAVYYAIKAVAGPEIQPNGGCYRALDVRTRPGSILEPGIEKSVVGGNHETSQRAVDAIMRALEAAVPERLSAGGSTTAVLLIFGGTRRDGATGTFYETHGGGEGARVDRDGMPVVRVHLSNTMITPVEIIEAEYMIRVDEQRIRPNSGGIGRHRGGDGMIRSYTVLADRLSLTTMFERRVVAPYGLQGGAEGATFRVTLHHHTGGSRELAGKENLILHFGDRVVMETSGGGGYGKPGAEEPAHLPEREPSR